MENNFKNLGQLIKSKGYIQSFIKEKLNEHGIQCNRVTFSRWCTGRHRPNNKNTAKILSDILNVSEETILNLI